jgi:hypothetical protein
MFFVDRSPPPQSPLGKDGGTKESVCHDGHAIYDWYASDLVLVGTFFVLVIVVLVRVSVLLC